MGNYTNQDCLNEIQKVSTAKLSIKTAIESKGVTVPTDTTFAGYAELIENIPQAKPEETLTQTITENGSHVFNPSEGHVFNSASITVDVPDPVLGTLNVTPTTSEQNITAQAEGYVGFSEVNVSAVTSSIDSNIAAENIKKDVTILGVTGTLESGVTPTGTINISDNGTYDVTDKATAVVAVGGKDYRYKTGTPDVAGLTAIGWTADDIGYYSANTPHYAWENDNYKVSQKNIDLYSLADPQPSLYKNDPDVAFVPNKNMSKYFSSRGAFGGMKYIKSIPWYDTSSMTDMVYMFEGCSSLQTIPLLDTSNAKETGYMFEGCSSLQTVPLLDTSKMTVMEWMFKGCSSLQTIPLLDTSNVKDAESMFQGCSSLQTIPLLDTSNVTNATSMFDGCTSLQTIPLLDTSNVESMYSMFSRCKSLTSVPQLNTSNVMSMEKTFYGCTSLQTIPLLDTSNVESMTSMFQNCTGLKSVSFAGTPSVTNMSDMFYNCSELTSVSFAGTSSATSMSGMLQNCTGLKSVEGVDFSSLTSYPSSFFGWTTIQGLTRFIVNGSINFSWTSGSFNITPNLDYESIKSILEAMNRTTNTKAKTMKFNTTIADQNGELAGLVSSCATKGWTVTGLTIN